ncbi:nucleolar protein 14 [Tricharina praecox]|uniref:nucleolar protein 14 n=1 Tax=Tricharina praecox TaxID=43433 RepID=UPI002220591F|nr:nucleolar protein 14 [Tricharina praecox]KAI5847010.1 nucleolar protein 14 [Tricharina praecox]
MVQSQLKRLKASLRTAGVTGQQKPKKAKTKRNASAADAKNDSRVSRDQALQSIREEFNPFEVKKTKTKHEISGQGRVKGKEGRPGLSKSIGEEHRKRTLLVEMQKRNKVGGIVDRRFGENDPTMAPEDRMLERFTREKQRRVRGGEIFNLEDEDELTHFGKSLGGLREIGQGLLKDDFDGEEDNEDGEAARLSRKRPLDGEDDAERSDDEEKGPDRKKSKAEVMKEVMAKSKLHKYERQKLKEDDEDEREKLDAEMGELWALLGTRQPSRTGAGSGANNEPLGGGEMPSFDRPIASKPSDEDKELRKKEVEYDQAVREMMFDKRSQPADRTKTEEEKAAAESERLKKLEDARQRRMRGEESEDEGPADGADGADAMDEDRGWEEEERITEAAAYGLGDGIPGAVPRDVPHGNPEDYLDGDYAVSEDDYVDVDEDGMVDGDVDFSDDEDDSVTGSDAEVDSDEEDFLADVLSSSGAIKKVGASTEETMRDEKLAFTFPCPQTHKEMLEIVKDIAVEDTPTVVQRIRVLHHAKLAAENKAKLQNFSGVLLEHIIYIANLTAPRIPFAAIELCIRHLHAMTKTYPEFVSTAFRNQLKQINDTRMNEDLHAGDLILFTAVSTIFPTSDHFHPVVTPSMLVMCRWLGQVALDSVRVLAVGSYLVTMCSQYQQLSKRYVPEAITFILKALSLLAPVAQAEVPGQFPYNESDDFRIRKASDDWKPRKLAFSDMFAPSEDTPSALLYTLLGLLERLTDLWAEKTAFFDVFGPVNDVLTHMSSKACVGHLSSELKKKLRATSKDLTSRLSQAQLSRRPLQLHHHRPLPIASNIPKFESDYSMDKHYDPDDDRREMSKLKAQHKREKKGAVREIRKDARFISRAKLQEDKKTSKEYHAKMARLTAMIQSEEGQAANEYKREKARR